MIEPVYWHSGAIEDEDKIATAYEKEKNSTDWRGTTNNQYSNDTVIRNNRWLGKVGIMSFSDYAFSTVGGSNIKYKTCLFNGLYYWDFNENFSDCRDNTWVHNERTWTMTFRNDSGSGIIAHPDVMPGVPGVSSGFAIKPAVYLKDSITIVSGNGSSTNPYKLAYYPKLSDHIISQASVDENLKYDGTDSLGEYGTSDNNLRYTGLTPNNYVYYNCSTTKKNEMNDETCEKWRIIGLFNNVEDKDGNLTSRVKIIRDESLGMYAYDTSTNSVNRGVGVSQWGESTYTNGSPYEGSDIMRELNTDYLGNITIGTDGKWYSGNVDKKDNDMPSTTLNEYAQEMIEPVIWHTGAIGYYLKIADTYEEEKNKPNWRGDGNSQLQNDTVVRSNRWLGKVGLMNFTDYAFSTAGGSTIKYKTCVANGLYYWDFNNDLEECRANSWISNENSWTINTREGTSYGVITHTGVIPGTPGLPSSYSIKPSVYLKDGITIVSGEGTSTNPYKLSLK
jgi:hypothetical protein